ncbi:hypothetical protein [Micromonospora sp. DH14]|uniref:hypothetical protein n=1 Tax=Micromonospora sp. DH14 TaxID=3040120 RepID=UPI002442E140|nr:hypothetical protein [Micromonospora sp. DH14]MDG9674029.1 hypothetical protein [Micromonospora sp. DH14]
MIETWYFCSAVHASPHHAEAFISVTEALTSRHSGADLLNAALRQLANCEPAMRRYAAPQVLAVAVRPGVEPGTAALARSALDDTLAVLDGSIRTAVAQAVEAIFTARSAETVAGHLSEAARRALARVRPGRAAHPYLDIESFTAEVVVLAACVEAARRIPASARLVVDETIGKLSRDALAGHCGRRAQLLAVELAAMVGDELMSSDDVVTQLLDPRIGAAFQEPDLLAAIARLTFGFPGTSAPAGPAPGAAGLISNEVVTLSHLRRLRRGRPDPSTASEALSRLGLSGQHPATIAMVLWQAVLDELSAEIDPQGTADALAHRWIAPHREINKPIRVRIPLPTHELNAWQTSAASLARLRTGNEKPVEFVVRSGPLQLSSWFSVAVLSPWFNRQNSAYNARFTRDPDEQIRDSLFPMGGDSVLLLRLMLAVCTAVRLLRSVETGRAEHLAALALHAADVLSDTRHRSFLSELAYRLESPNPSMSLPLAGLALHTYREYERAGDGRYPEIEPSVFADLLLADHHEEALPQQERWLRGRPGVSLVTGWIENALSGTVPDLDTGGQGRWRQPVAGGLSLAERVLIRAVQILPPSLTKRPAALLRLHFGRDEEGAALTPWYERDVHPSRVSNQWEVLAVPPLSADGWRRYPSLVNDRHGVQLALLTERLAALLAEPDLISEAERTDWVEQWRTAINAVTKVRELSRPVRMRLLAALDQDIEGHSWQRLILEDIIDTEIEFGLGTPLDRWLMFERLGPTAVLPPYLAEALRHRLLRGLYQRQSVDQQERLLNNPWLSLGVRRSNALLTMLMQRLVFELGPADVVIGGHTLSDFVLQLWQDAHQNLRLTELSIPVDEDEGAHGLVDPRLLAGLTVDPVDGVLRVHSRRSPQLRTFSGASVEDPFRLSPEQFGRLLGNDPSYVIGMVCAARDGQVWVNCGLADPLAVPAPVDVVRVGDQVAVPLRRSIAGPAAAGPIERLASLPVVGDLRPATIERPANGRLVVRVADAMPFDVAALPQQARRSWDPDLLGELEELPVGEYPALARWEGEHWLPVDREYVEFLAILTGRGEPAPIRLVVIELVRQGRSIRFSAGPGCNVVLDNQVWDDGDRADLLAAVREAAGDPCGLVVTADLHGDDVGAPRLRLRREPGRPAEDALDVRALRWRDLFRDGSDHEARLVDGTWRFDPRLADLPDVVVTGLDAPGTLCRFTPSAWGEEQQRRRQVAGRVVPARHLNLPDRPDRELFERLVDLADGHVVHLRTTVAEPQWGMRRGYTVEGIAVDVEAESIWLGPVSARHRVHQRLRQNRQSQVCDVRTFELPTGDGEPAPVPNINLTAGLAEADREAGEDALVRQHELRGIVVDAPITRSRADVYTVLLDLGVDIAVCSLRRENFDRPPTGVGAIVRGRRSRHGWIFTAYRRRIRVRAVWEYQNEVPPSDAIGLGVVQWRGQRKALAQSTNRPVLYLYDDLSATAHLRPVGANGEEPALSAGTVEMSRVYPDRDRRRMAVRYADRRGSAEVHGETRYVQAGPFSRVVGVDVALEDVDPGHVVVRRSFSLSTGVAQQPAATPAPGQSSTDGYYRYLAGERSPLTATLSGSTVTLQTEWTVPTPTGGSTWQIPLAEGEEPWVAVAYRSNDVRVVLLELAGGVFASYRTAPALSMAEFFRHFQRQGIRLGIRSDLRGARLHYVDRRETAQGVMHRFEWGYGHTLELNEQALTIDGRPAADNAVSLFHGDFVTDVLIDQRAGTQDLVLDIRMEHIRWGWYAQLHREAANQVIHLADIVADQDGGRPRIKALHVRWRKQPADGPVYRDTQTVVLRRLRLAPEASRRITDAWQAERREARPDRPNQALVRLDVDKFRRSGGAQVEFHFISPTFDNGELPQGCRLFLTADEIRPLPNDVALTLRGGDLIGGGSRTGFEVAVLRRDFSRRQALLQHIHRNAEPGTHPLRGAVYLVKLTRIHPADNRAEGSIVGGPGRPHAALMSRLANDETPCFATVVRQGDRIELEVRPNVVFRFSADAVANADEARNGSIVRLLRGPDRSLMVRQALLGDAAYLPREGRPVQLLPMQNLLSRRDDGATALGRGSYTVVGLPSVIVPASRRGRAPDAQARELIATPHPKLGIVRREARNSYHLERIGSDVRVGILRREADGTLSATGRGADGVAWRTRVRWAQVSFFDRGANGIREWCDKSSWEYHDSTTGYREGERLETVTTERLNPSATVWTDPVFLGSGGMLRYSADELRQYGLPATELVDGGAGRKVGRPRTYAVGGVTHRGGRPSGLWIEVAPGRLIEVTGPMMSTPDGNSLDGVDWSSFAPGDRVTLSVQRHDPTEIGGLVLHEWISGPRGALGRRALLPIGQTDTARRSVRMGVGIWSATLPTEPDEAHRKDSLVWLTDRNEVTPAGERPVVGRGDTVLLAEGEAGLSIVGLPDRVPVVAGSDSMAGWLVATLKDPADRRALFELCEGALPVTVEEVSGTTIRCSRRRHDRDLSPGELTVLQPLGVLPSGELLLRRGFRLAVGAVGDLVPGLPLPLVDQAIQTIRRTRQPLWAYADRSTGVRLGLPDEPSRPAEEITVRPVGVIGTGADAGIICLERRTNRPRWLPATEVGWTPLDAEHLHHYLGRPNSRQRLRELSCRLLPDGTVSLVRTAANLQRFEQLRLGDPLRVEVVGEEATDRLADGRHRYIVRAYMSDILLDMRLEGSAPPLTAEPRLCEVDRRLLDRGSPRISVCDPDQRHLALDLPAWLIPQAPDRSSAVDPSARGEYQALLAGAGAVVHGDAGPSEDHQASLGRWLATDAAAAFGLGAPRDIELAPAVAAALLLDAMRGHPSVGATAAAAAVHLCRQLALRAIRSRHLEPLLHDWIGDPDTAVKTDLWRRLDQVNLGPVLKPADFRTIKDVQRGIRARTALRPDRALSIVMESLAASAGAHVSYDEIEGYEGVLGSVAALGRPLAPSPGQVTAQRELLPAQRDALGRVLWGSMQRWHGLTLLPVPPIVQDPDCARSAQLLEGLVGVIPAAEPPASQA